MVKVVGNGQYNGEERLHASARSAHAAAGPASNASEPGTAEKPSGAGLATAARPGQGSAAQGVLGPQRTRASSTVATPLAGNAAPVAATKAGSGQRAPACAWGAANVTMAGHK